jgi:cytochrome bd-type quinol oxidase subunit 2
MINFEVFLIGLMIVSTLTGLTTEAVKHILTACNVKYQSNVLSGIVAVILSAAVGIAYIVIAGVGFTAQPIISVVVLAFMSWLSAMVGYDKVVQVINQFKNIKKG